MLMVGWGSSWTVQGRRDVNLSVLEAVKRWRDGVEAGFGLRLNTADVVAVGEEVQLGVKSC